MGRGTPCPMPPDNRKAIHDVVTAFHGAGISREEIARALQHLWPGCTANHVRGVIGGRHLTPPTR